MRSSGFIVLGAVVTATIAACTTGDAGSSLAEDVLDSQQALVGGASRSDVAVGAAVFDHEFPATHGNGRACSTCHVPEDHFGLTPARVAQRWNALQAALAEDPEADDPLFRGIDADVLGGNTFNNLKRGLVRVRLALPENVDLLTPPAGPNMPPGPPLPQRYVDVWRAVPTVENVALTAPYQQDGRFATLEEQALGALHDHAEIQSEPNPKFVTAVANFQKNVFSSPLMAAWAAANEKGEPLPNPEPPLNALEQQGKVAFDKSCGTCHGGVSQSSPRPPLQLQFHSINISKPLGAPSFNGPLAPPPGPGVTFPMGDIIGVLGGPTLPVAFYRIRVTPPGVPPQYIVRPSTDPGRFLQSGNPVEFNTFDIPTLRGVSNTAPYFHDNSAADLERVLVVYDEFFKFVQRVEDAQKAAGILPPNAKLPINFPVDPADKPALLAYLRKI